jgi:hypothetical protein
MKTLWIMVTLLILLGAGVVETAVSETSGTDRVRCCVRGRCMYVTKAACVKFKGTVVANCGECR